MAEELRGPSDLGAPQSSLTTQTTEHDGAVIVSVAGELDMVTVNQAAVAVKEAIARGDTVILDMTGLRFFSSAGLTLLLQLHEAVQDSQVEVHLAGDQRVVTRPLELTGLTELFPIHKSITEALAAAGR